MFGEFVLFYRVYVDVGSRFGLTYPRIGRYGRLCASTFLNMASSRGFWIETT